MLTHFLDQKYPVLPREVAFMCDNCPGQNKNRWVIWYCSYLTLVRPECDVITLHFMVPGHTKMLNDGKFGLLSRKLKLRDCYTTKEMCGICKESGKGMQAIDVGDEDVPFYNFKEFLGENFEGTVPGVMDTRLFQFRKSDPGVCFYKKKSDDNHWNQVQLLKKGYSAPLFNKLEAADDDEIAADGVAPGPYNFDWNQTIAGEYAAAAGETRAGNIVTGASEQVAGAAQADDNSVVGSTVGVTPAVISTEASAMQTDTGASVAAAAADVVVSIDAAAAVVGVGDTRAVILATGAAAAVTGGEASGEAQAPASAAISLMRVKELKAALKALGLPVGGLKPTLVARLQEARAWTGVTAGAAVGGGLRGQAATAAVVHATSMVNGKEVKVDVAPVPPPHSQFVQEHALSYEWMRQRLGIGDDKFLTSRAKNEEKLRVPVVLLSSARHMYMGRLADKYFTSEREDIRGDFILPTDTTKTSEQLAAEVKEELTEMERKMAEMQDIGTREEIDAIMLRIGELRSELEEVAREVTIDMLVVKAEDLKSTEKLEQALSQLECYNRLTVRDMDLLITFEKQHGNRKRAYTLYEKVRNRLLKKEKKSRKRPGVEQHASSFNTK